MSETKKNQITLTGEQHRVINLPFKNPILIRGGAGSGKTTVAAFRAKHLATDQELFRNTHVCVFSYTKSLQGYLKSLLVNYHGSAQISIFTIHSWIWKFLDSSRFWNNHKTAKKNQLDSAISKSISTLRRNFPNETFLRKSNEFFRQEFAWLKGKNIHSLDQYLETERRGRGTQNRVTQAHKPLIWEVFTHFQDELNNQSLVEFDDYPNLALEFIGKDKGFQPPFSHIVIDEAQDLSTSQLKLINKLVMPSTQSITIVADEAQKIYKSGFTWAEVGIDIPGARSIELKHNYRNTIQIYSAASSLLAHDPDHASYSDQLPPVRELGKPKYYIGISDSDQLVQIREIVSKINLNEKSVAILHRNRNGTNYIFNNLSTHNFTPTNIISNNAKEITLVGLYTSTMSSAKGLEFDHVIICSLNEGIFPEPAGFLDKNDETHLATERRLLYTCMTRAKSYLYLMAGSNPSRFIDEIDDNLLEFVLGGKY